MSAEQYGARLLDEVHEESLEKFLADLRHTICPQPKAILGILQLDRLLETGRYSAQTTPQRLAWQSPTATSPAVDNERDGEQDLDDSRTTPRTAEASAHGVQAKPATIEFTSPKSASGKTALLTYLSAMSVLPSHLGGKESTVAYIDADGRFSPTRLVQIMHHYLAAHWANKSTADPISDSDIADTTKEALSHIHIFRPQSSSQLLTILSCLSKYLFDGTRHPSIHRSLGLIVIDSATAFYWQDRFDRSMARLDTPGHASAQGPSTTAQIIELLKCLQERFECAVLFSTTTSSPTSSSTPAKLRQTGPTAPAPELNERVISPWTAYATLTLALSRVPIAQFALQMGMEECMRDRELRFEAVRKGRFVATVQGKGKGEGAAAGFGFSIGEEGVDFD